jgi:hypothetical protein
MTLVVFGATEARRTAFRQRGRISDRHDARFPTFLWVRIPYYYFNSLKEVRNSPSGRLWRTATPPEGGWEPPPDDTHDTRFGSSMDGGMPYTPYFFSIKVGKVCHGVIGGPGAWGGPGCVGKLGGGLVPPVRFTRQVVVRLLG